MVESIFETHIARVNRQVVPTREGEEERVRVEVTDLGQRLGGAQPGRKVLEYLTQLEMGIVPLDPAITLIRPEIDKLEEGGIISGAEATSIFTVVIDSVRRRQERKGR